MTSPTPEPDKTPTTRKSGAYLPVLPDGWTWEVTLKGPGTHTVHVRPRWRGGIDGWVVAVTSDGGDTESEIVKPTLDEACKTAAKAARGLAAIAEAEAKADKARRALLRSLGAEPLDDGGEQQPRAEWPDDPRTDVDE